jgi:DNA-binding protein HU-beta
MSRHNKVNRDHYMTAGRLSPDDLARERRKQAEPLWGATKSRKRKVLPPWMANDNTPPLSGSEEQGVAAEDTTVHEPDQNDGGYGNADVKAPTTSAPRAASAPAKRATAAKGARTKKSAKSAPSAKAAKSTTKRATKTTARKRAGASKTARAATSARSGKSKSAKSAK